MEVLLRSAVRICCDFLINFGNSSRDGKKLVMLEAFILLVRCYSSNKQYAPASMISEITNPGESQLSSQSRLGGGGRGHVLTHRSLCGKLRSSLCPGRMCWTPGKS